MPGQQQVRKQPEGNFTMKCNACPGQVFDLGVVSDDEVDVLVGQHRVTHTLSDPRDAAKATAKAS